MMVIRLGPSVVKLIAFYANLMLLSSFLGSRRRDDGAQDELALFDFFPLFSRWKSGRSTCAATSASASTRGNPHVARARDRRQQSHPHRHLRDQRLLFVPSASKARCSTRCRLTAYAWISPAASPARCASAFFRCSIFPALGSRA